MNKYHAPKIDEADFIQNPLVGSDFKILINKVIDGKHLQLVDGVLVPTEIEYERGRYSKVYLKPEHRKMVSMLSPGGKSLYLWIIYELDAGKDYLWVNRTRYMEENRLTSVNTYKKAMAELVRLTFLCPSMVKDVYWINPRLIFCGSRVNRYPNNLSE